MSETNSFISCSFHPPSPIYLQSVSPQAIWGLVRSLAHFLGGTPHRPGTLSLAAGPGGDSGPNYSAEKVAEARRGLEKAGLRAAVGIDCAHNAADDLERQCRIVREVAASISQGQGLAASLFSHSAFTQICVGGAVPLLSNI